MRRAFVIFLILLFPLNVLAVSVSASSAPDTRARHYADPATPPEAIGSAEAFDCQAMCEIDPDEPPPGTDLHDTLNEDGRLQLAVLPGMMTVAAAPPRRGLPPFPPLTPPPVA